MKTEKKEIINQLLNNIKFGARQVYQNMIVYPVFYEENRKVKYISMAKAFNKEAIEVSETNVSGTVPELKVINKGKKRVLMIEGEELMGAKQNRVLNTTILLKKNSETIIPVSCTEAGRWSNSTSNFADSDVFALPQLRKKKMRSVSDSLNRFKSFRSNQGEVWDHVDEILDETKANAPTRAMKEVYNEKKKDTESYVQEFNCSKGQKGILVLINGEIVGLDYVSSSKVFSLVFAKLIQSYAIEADINKYKEQKEEQSVIHFINSINEAEPEVFKSSGHGYDYRLSGEKITGSALVYKNKIIHFSAFPFSDSRRFRRINF